MSQQEITQIPISELHLWTENPRDPIEVVSTDFEIISRAITNGNNKWNLQKLLDEMGEYYDLSELPTVIKKDEKFIVYDGNRRIAILKYLQNKELYSKLKSSLSFKKESKELKDLTIISCNVCDIETALKNVERKHTNSKDWGRLERDYFHLKHLNKEKSHFIRFDEQTNLISSVPVMNQRFVKDEMLTEENLEEIGFKYDPKIGFISNYSEQVSKKILDGIVGLVENKIVSTRKNRKQLKRPLLTHNPELKKIVRTYDPKQKSTSLSYTAETKAKVPKKTAKSKENEILFGKILILKKGKVNDLYRAILNIYEKNHNDNTVLPIIGMAMRLITEVAARVYFDKTDPEKAKRDQLYDDFLRTAKKEMSLSQKSKNYLSLTKDWLDSKHNLEAILAKYAHGNIIASKDGILQSSVIIGEVLEHYFKK